MKPIARSSRTVLFTLALVAATAAVVAGFATASSSSKSAALPNVGACDQVLAAGSIHSLAIAGGNNGVWAWGQNYNGQLGDDSNSDRHAPVKVHGINDVGFLTNVQAVAAAGWHSLAIASNNTVLAWGYGYYGQLGNDNNVDEWTPVRVHGPGDVGNLSNVIAIAAGRYHSLALRKDGTVWSWGRNNHGQLGNDDDGDQWTPVQVRGPGDVGYLNNVVAIGAGNYYSVALKKDGTVWTWGQNEAGQLGNNDNGDQWTPVQVHGPGDVGYLRDIVEIAPQRHQVLARKANGTVWGWGSNGSYELGDNTNSDRWTPVQVHGEGDVGFLTGIGTIGTGGHHSLAVTMSGRAWAWGRNGNGQVGDNTTSTRFTPVPVHGKADKGVLKGILKVVGGDLHSLALDADGRAWSWGYNFFGQLGDTSTSDRWTPVPILGLLNVPCFVH